MLEIDQKDCLKKLKPLPKDAKFNDFVFLRMKLAWLSSTREDLSFEVSQLSQVTVSKSKENSGLNSVNCASWDIIAMTLFPCTIDRTRLAV